MVIMRHMALMDDLSRLMNVDRQVRGLRSRLESAQRYFDAQTRQLQEVEARLEELGTRRRHIQAKIANLEMEGKSKDEQLEKFRGDLNSAATNKQYTAVLTELNTVKTQRGKIDDDLLAEMTALESLEQEVAGIETQRDERRKVRDVAETQLEERKADVGERLAELEAEREAAANALPPADLAVFEELANVYDGDAMATVEEIDARRREYMCSECNMQLPFEKVSALMNTGANIVRCAACGRILCMQEEIRGAMR